MNTQQPLILSKRDVAMKLWEAREQLEAEALDAEESRSDVARPNESGRQPSQPAVNDDKIKRAVREDKKQEQAQTAAPQRAASADQDLMSPTVTEGLKRLLEEWPYFKKSGVLGFGPGGMEHPIYKRIADVPVRDVLTGRFDEPDQDLIEEIREYVGGWRREQNVEPQEEETFEMYLRRVIAAILQKRSQVNERTNSAPQEKEQPDTTSA